jgi:hypothetical protein
MKGEDWELRREARRCHYAASIAPTEGARRMLEGYARFYSTLAETEQLNDNHPRCNGRQQSRHASEEGRPANGESDAAG